MELIRLEDIHKTYHLGEVDVPVLRGISLSIARGELVALMGASGSGKTTLMNILGCLDHSSSGKYWFDGQEMSRLAPNQRALVRTSKLGFVFQSFNLLPRTSALGNVQMPLDYAPEHYSDADTRKWALRLLDRVGLSDRIDHEPSQMSGGQQQRVAIARSLINNPSLLLADEPTGNLDSRTSVEILRMFQELNAEGITVILVTHDPHVAAYANRVIRITDGRVESDAVQGREAVPSSGNGNGADLPAESTFAAERSGGGTAAALAPPAMARRILPRAADSPAAALDKDFPRMQRKGLALRFPRTLRTALCALRRNMIRSALTALGVIIGVGAVIAMMEIGEGSKAELQRTIASMGANTLMIMPGAATAGGFSHGSGSKLTLTPQDMEEIRRQCPAVAEVAPIVGTWGQAIFGNRNYRPNQITGTTPAYLIVRDWQNMSEGEMFGDRDVRSGSNVCVVGETVRRELFQGASPIGEELRVQNVSLRVIGVLSRKGANMMGMDQDDVILAPWPTIKYRVNGSSNSSSQTAAASSTGQINSLNNLYPGAKPLYTSPTALQAANTPQPVRFANIDRIMVKAVSAEEIPQAMDQITALLRERHHLTKSEEDDFNIRDMTEITRTLSSTSRLMGALLLVVALISLVVGGVGIMNIMLVSVTERTREIGLRMAVGARSHHILRQFLVEAIVLCLFGGAMGILLGRGASMMVRAVMRWPTEASIPAILAAVAVSAAVGVFFGFYPAWKASRLDPIEALRYE
ncbi:MAG: ABC transporter permease [Pirellulales bacterium]|nr:ABC transporter permease [Pirellulales bacterium]